MSKQNILILISLTYIISVCAFFTQTTVLCTLLMFILLTIFTIIKKLPVKVYLASLFIILTALVNCSLRIKNHDDLVSYAPSNVTITARVLSIPTTNNSDRTKFYANVKTIITDGEEKDDINAKTLVTVYDERDNFSKIQIGDTLKLSGRLTNAVSSQNPYQFNYAKYLKSKGTFTLFYSKPNEWQILSRADTFGWKFLAKLNTQRTKIINKHAQNIKSPNLEILGGIIFGDDAVNPTDEIRQSFINSGLLHILAASGMNVTLIFGIWFFITQRLRFNYRFSILAGMGIIIFYTCMTGFGASILRATIMLLFILLGKLLDRTTDTLALLFLVALIMLIYNPSMLNDVGFQLSFIVTFGLLFTTPIFNNKINNKWLNICFVSVLVPLIAQLYAAPLQMYYFNTLSLYSVFANILIIPVLSIVSFLGFISSILAGIDVLAFYVCKISSFVLNPFISWIVWVADLFSKLPNSIINIYKFNFYSLIFYYSVLILGTIFVINKDFRLKQKIILPVLCLCFFSTFITIPNKDTEIIFFSVGNADSALIKSPNNKYFLIDTGRLPYQSINSSGKQVILKYLRGKSIKELDSITLTHFDSDHAGGTVDILSGFRVPLVYTIENQEDTNVANNISDYISANNIKNIIVKDKETVHEEDGFLLTNYVNQNAESENDHSIMTLLETNGKRAVFMGDCRAGMLRAIPFDTFDIIKIGHHGAEGTTTPELIKNTKSAIISTGTNSYGHPSKETLENLKNTFYMRTDNNNAIKVIIKKDKTEFYSYYPHKKKFVKVREM